MTIGRHSTALSPVAALARPSGTFAMVAADQRDSLRTMMAERSLGSAVPDERLTEFKLAVARETGPYASALLIDRHYGYRELAAGGVLKESCALILAADELDQPPGGPVLDTSIDPAVDPAWAAQDGAAALKLLVIWRRDEHRERRVESAARFIALCEAAGLASVLEPVARPTSEEQTAGTFDLNAAIVEAATELGALRPSLYKCQIPGHGQGSVARIAAEAERIDAALAVPWVVLSQGVAIRDFPHAVEAACRAGASGFLAGRAIWSDALDAVDPLRSLREVSVPRLRCLGDIVDRHARPWYEAPVHSGVPGNPGGGSGVSGGGGKRT